MNELARTLDELAADAPIERATWSDVVARAARIPPPKRRIRTRVGIAAAVGAALLLGGVAVADGPDLLRQQEKFHAAPDHARVPGTLAEVVSGEGWAVFAWLQETSAPSGRDNVCLDYAVAGNSAFSCVFRVPGAMAPDYPSRGGLPFHVVGGTAKGGAGFVGGDGMTAIVGVATPEVTRVEVELADGRVLDAPLYDAPRRLGVDLGIFVARARLSAHIDSGRANPVRPFGPANPVLAYRAYGRDGRLIERVTAE